MKKLDKKLFMFAENDFLNADKIEGDSLGFWRDAWRRLRKNKISMISLIVFLSLVFMAIFGP